MGTALKRHHQRHILLSNEEQQGQHKKNNEMKNITKVLPSNVKLSARVSEHSKDW